ncbi:MAG TPA: hypothetical protein VHH34_21560 [Pseudonocardiaceae bacterium]|nr:hypothetical protein [Pseudonocardiaceae bacterium]
MRSTPSHRVPSASAVSPLSLEERAAALDAEVSRLLDKGAELESHTATVAVVVCPEDQPNQVTDLVLTFLRYRLGLFTRATTAPEKGAPEIGKWARLMLTVDEGGNLTRWALPR